MNTSRLERDAGYRASDATTSYGQIFGTQHGCFRVGYLRVRKSDVSDLRGGRHYLRFGRHCNHLMVMNTTSMTAPSRSAGNAVQIGHSSVPLV